MQNPLRALFATLALMLIPIWGFGAPAPTTPVGCVNEPLPHSPTIRVMQARPVSLPVDALPEQLLKHDAPAAYVQARYADNQRYIEIPIFILVVIIVGLLMLGGAFAFLYMYIAQHKCAPK
jgi:hypothetical protein